RAIRVRLPAPLRAGRARPGSPRPAARGRRDADPEAAGRSAPQAHPLRELPPAHAGAGPRLSCRARLPARVGRPVRFLPSNFPYRMLDEVDSVVFSFQFSVFSQDSREIEELTASQLLTLH